MQEKDIPAPDMEAMDPVELEKLKKRVLAFLEDQGTQKTQAYKNKIKNVRPEALHRFISFVMNAMLGRGHSHLAMSTHDIIVGFEERVKHGRRMVIPLAGTTQSGGTISNCARIFEEWGWITRDKKNHKAKTIYTLDMEWINFCLDEARIPEQEVKQEELNLKPALQPLPQKPTVSETKKARKRSKPAEPLPNALKQIGDVIAGGEPKPNMMIMVNEATKNIPPEPRAKPKKKENRCCSRSKNPFAAILRRMADLIDDIEFSTFSEMARHGIEGPNNDYPYSPADVGSFIMYQALENEHFASDAELDALEGGQS